MSKHINPWRLFTGIFIPEWLVQRPEVSQGAKICYGRLARYAGRDGQCFPRQSTLAEEIGVEIAQVRRYLAELSKAGLIEWSRPGLGRSNSYRFLQHEWMGLDEPQNGFDLASNLLENAELSHTITPEQSHTITPEHSDPIGHKRVRQESQSNESHIRARGGRRAERVTFDERILLSIYEAYPLKAARGKALEAIAKAITRVAERRELPTGTAVGWLRDRVNRYAEIRDGNLEYVPHCSTWMNQDRWADDETSWVPRRGRPETRRAPRHSEGF